MSESPEVERGSQNLRGRSNLKRGPEHQKDETDPTQPTEVRSIEDSPKGNQMKNMGRTDKVGMA